MLPYKIFFFTFIFFLTATGSVRAYAEDIDLETNDDNLISLYGTACEPIKSGEMKSSVRVRATDKASFTAVENIAELSDYRNSFSGHDFNVLIYNIVDNYVEDLAVRTTKQTAEEICVEVTGYLNAENILKSLNENYQKLAAAERDEEATEQQIKIEEGKYPEALEIEDENALKLPIVTALPPKPQIAPSANSVENDELWFDEMQGHVNKQTAEAEPQVRIKTQPMQNPSIQFTEEHARPTAVPNKKNSEVLQLGENPNIQEQTLVFIDKTRFFNDTETGRYFNDVKELFKDKTGIEITADKNKADYIIKPKVLRAKVDPINAKTNRLQLVISLELLDTENGKTIVEHQNRFILFGSDENEQIVASTLMKKLIKKAGEVITSRIPASKNALLNSNDSIITPTTSNYGLKK